jgi:hypothetical protein
MERKDLKEMEEQDVRYQTSDIRDRHPSAGLWTAGLISAWGLLLPSDY